jgi:hypothetical protein
MDIKLNHERKEYLRREHIVPEETILEQNATWLLILDLWRQ